jgi:protein phosphatase
MRLKVYGHTEKGPRHEVNEDVLLIGHSVHDSGAAEWSPDGENAERGVLIAVADGMGSHAVGAAAGRLMLQALDDSFCSQAQNTDMRGLVNILYSAAKEANRAVLDYSTRDPQFAEMGSTLAGVIVLGNEYVAFNAGDSRVYHFCRGVLRQMTEDDTLVAMAVRKGRMTQSEAEASPQRHFVTNATGSRSFRLHVSESGPLEPGDALLLCSDGLHGVVRFVRMEWLFARFASAEERCKALVDAAQVRGGYDDLSVIVINAEAPDSAD